MLCAILLTEEETDRFEAGDEDIARAIERTRRNANATVVLGDDGDDLYDTCFNYKCPHKRTYCNDRMQTVCEDCSEELGR